ncbi:hypothetical protein FRC06_010619 [Ceratobasidium sp. 370]|nr:hypothetical protein FRC06_010619 [Ceratobasidium sp. 370]
MAATHDNPIIFWDIIGADGQYWAPNPYKTRLTLNYKGLLYRVKYIKFEEVEPTMKAMGIPPTSKTYYTLPIITDPSSDPNGEPTHVSDSFNTMYLDEKYPASNKDKFAPLSDADTAQRLAELRERLDAFAQALETNGGPWVMGDAVTFADFVVGCALYFWHEVDGDEGRIWKEVAGWQNGKWAAIREKVETIQKKSIGLGQA